MQSISDLLASVLRGVLKLALLAFAVTVIAGILLIGLSAALLTLVWSLLTGRKPAAWQTFMRFRQTSQQFRAGVWPGTSTPSSRSSQNDADIVDVQAHEVRNISDDPR
jgi:hypothetical protein